MHDKRADRGPARHPGIPEVRTYSLPNGMGLLVAEDHALPVVCSTLWYRVGARDEKSGQTGISHLLEHLMFKGARRFPKGAIDAVTLRLGGHDNAFTSYDYTGYYFAFASDRWETALDIEADRMTGLLLDAGEFRMEKQVVLEELSMGEDNPWEHLRRNVLSLAFRRHPYRNPIIGWREDLERITRAQVRRWYREHYHPANAFMVISGDVRADRALEAVEKRFGTLPGRPVRDRKLPPDPPPDGLIRFTSRMPSHGQRLIMAFHGPSAFGADLYAANLLQYILSEGKTSRVYQRLVEKDQTVSAVSLSFEDMMDPSLVSLAAEIKPGVPFEAVEDAVFDELRRVTEHGVAEAELERARRQLLADFVFESEDIVNVAVNLGVYECIGSHKIYTGFLDRALQVGDGEIREAAGRIFTPDRCVIGRMAAGRKGVVVDGLAGEDEAEIPGPAFRCHYRDGNPAPPAPAPARPGAARGGPRVHLDIRELVLDNGLRVFLCPMPRIPAIYASGVVLAGGREDPAGLQGMGYLLGNLLDEGTTRHSHAEISAYFDERGGVMESFATRESSGVTFKVLTEDFPRAFDLLAEMIFDASFPEDRLELVQSQVLSRLVSLEDRPEYLGSKEFNRLVYDGTPLAHPLAGYKDTVPAVRREHLVDFHRKWFHAGNALLTLVGDFQADRMAEVVRDRLGAVCRGERLPRPDFGLRRQTGPLGERIRVNDREQLHLFLGHLGIRRTDPDYYRLLVMDIILGGGPGFTSRIPRKLRDEMGLAYTTWAGICSSAGPDPGSFTAYIGTSPDKRDLALEGMQREIRAIRDDLVSEDELSAAKDYLTGSFVFKFETLSQVASFILAAHVYGLGFDYIDRFPELVGSVTARGLRDAARRHLDPDAMTLVEVGP